MKFDEIKNRQIQKNGLLDCESRDSTLASVCTIFELPASDVLDFLRQFDLEEYLKKNRLSATDQCCALLLEVLLAFDCNWGFSQTSWFHFTRCPDPEIYFQNGLLSLPDLIDDIWDFIFKLSLPSMDRDEWDTLRKKTETDNETYKIRLNSISQHGPDAVLIGDFNFNKILGLGHLLECPEIIHQIIYQSQNVTHQDYLSVTNPCMVKFITESSEALNLGVALNYLYELEQTNPDFNYYQNRDYIGSGVSIPSSQIKKVILLNPLAKMIP